MPLPSGTRLGSYEITHVLGAGGMGEVYRARDSKLGRSVAIKIILQPFAGDVDRVARFEREAKVLASLNHQHIASLYGMEESDGQHFLVMELVEGETLAERLHRGAMPLEDAVRIALQIADALETAHEKGIVHRDLKPANVKITPDEKVKVLDFGLAKAMETEDAGANIANSPTLSIMATNAGVILGTAAYMSPEQAKGFAADHRSDIFSFGVLFYEMLTGRQPFQGETAPDILASVLVREPELQRLPSDLNPRLPELLRRCLEKSPKRRWQAIGDVRAELEAIAAMPRAAAQVGTLPRGPLWRRAIPVAAAAIVTGTVAAIAAWQLKPAPAREITRFAAALPNGQQFTGIARSLIAVSRDGKHYVYVANGQLFLRPLSALAAKPIPGTELYQTVFSPAFSPDGQSIAFVAGSDRTIKRIAITGGSAVTMCQVTTVPFALDWDDSGILFSTPEGVMRVSANGGTPEKLVAVRDEMVQRAQMLPGGETVLFTVTSGAASSGDRWSVARIVAQSMKTGARKTLVEGASDGLYVPTGHLLYVMSGTLHAAPFDVRTLTVKSGPVPVLEGIRRSPLSVTGIAWFGISATGTIVYVPGPATLTSSQMDVGLIDRKGTVTPFKLPQGPYDHPRISPDGKRIAVDMDDGKEVAILTYDVSGTRALQRVTFDGKNRFPVWTADSKRIVFQSDRGGDLGLYWQVADGTTPAERLTTAAAGEAHQPESWQPGGDVLLFTVVKGTDQTLWMYTAHDKKTAQFPGVQSGISIDAVFHPDGKWVAYSTGSGLSSNVYVQPFPPTGALYQVSRTSSEQPHHPLWSPDRKELLYNPRPTTLDAVSVTTRPTFAFGPPIQVPKAFATGPPAVRRSFDIAPDGRIVGLIIPGDQNTPTAPQVNVVLNWLDELKARVPNR